MSQNPSETFITELGKKVSLKIEMLNKNLNWNVFKNAGRFSQIEVITCGSGKPLLFLHGLGSVPSAYEKTIKHLAKEYFVIAPSLPGHGLTDLDSWLRNGEQDFFSNSKEFVSAVKKALNINSKIIIAGHNFGGIIGAHYAKANPKGVEKLVLIDASFEQVNLLSLRAIFSIIKMNIEFLYDSRKVPMQVAKYFIANIKSMAYFARFLRKYIGVEDLKNLNVETQIYWGENDSLFSLKYAKKITKFISGSSLKIIKNRDHNWLLDAPEGLSL